MLGHLFDVDAALGGGHEGDLRGVAVEDDAEVELAVDVAALFDVETANEAAFGAGLVGDERGAEDSGRMFADLRKRASQLDAASLAATAGVNLRLDDPERAAQLLRGSHGLIDGEGGDAARSPDTELLEELLRLILVNVHTTLRYGRLLGAEGSELAPMKGALC